MRVFGDIDAVSSHSHQYSQAGENSQKTGASVAHKRQRNARYRQKTDIHANMDCRLDYDENRHSDAKKPLKVTLPVKSVY